MENPNATCSKKLTGYPFAHRQHTHKGHCSLIHGHTWDFEFTFNSTERDANGFILDFGTLGWLKEFLADNFDHTLVLAESDPLYQVLGVTPGYFAKVVKLPAASCEGICEFLKKRVSELLFEKERGRVTLLAITVWESPNNRATLSCS